VALVTEAHTVKFACDGTITLGSTIAFWVDTILDGSGHQVTISGGNLVQVFQVNNNVSLTLINLTIANGLSTNGYGGGIYNGGTVNAMNCHFIANQAQGAWGGYYGLPGKDGCGGAVYNSGTLNIIDCSFAWNSARGGKGGEGIMTSYLPAGIGGVGGAGNGGAIYNLGLLAIKGSTFTSNSTIGGTGGFGGGGAMSLYPIDGGAGGMGGDGNGSILFNNGSASLVNSTFALNSSIGGAGGPGGGGNQPAVPDYGYGKTGPNGLGGSGFGAICDTNGHIYLTNCTLAFNSGTGSTAFGGLKISGGQLVNTLLATTPPGSNCLGKITDAGHNLSSDGSCAFTNIGSRNNVDPKLSPLANNGGPTLTMALLPGSPAIDAGDNASAPPTDQRGVVRPSGVASDIGAYECSPPSLTIPPPTQTAEIGTTIEFTAQASTFTPATYQWFFNGNAINGCTNSVLCLSGIQASNVGAYTLVVSNIAGVVTSSPAMLNVIAPVERRPVPGIKLTGEAGSLLNVDYANSLSPSPNWTTLGSVSLTSTSQFCPDLTMPLPPERFYRAWQTGTPGVVPSLNLNFVPAIMLTGKVGDSLHLDCINAIGPTNDWVTLATVTLTNTSQLYFDVSAPGQSARLYRIVPAP
jgi:hypothetical protein